MELPALIVVLIFVAALFAIILGWNRKHSEKPAFREGLDSLQRSLIVLQQEMDRASDARLSQLRSELANQLEVNRRELHQSLMANSQTSDQKVERLDEKWDTRLKEMSQGVQEKLEKNLKDGFLQFEKVQYHLNATSLQLQHLNEVGKSINDLNSLLRLPHLRGGFGEAFLEKILADFLPSEAYELQYCIVPGASERVDAIIKHPKSLLPIDSKFPREQVLPLFDTSDPQALEAARKQLAELIKGQAKQIRAKYIHPEHGTADMALLFVPSETLYFEILRNVKLSEELGKLKVFAVSPNTLAITLHGIGIARDYYEMAKSVDKTLVELRKAQKHFENFGRKFDDVGKFLKKAQESFDIATTHLWRYSSNVSRVTGMSSLVQSNSIQEELSIDKEFRIEDQSLTPPVDELPS